MGGPAKLKAREKPVEQDKDPVSGASPSPKKTKQKDDDRVELLNKEKRIPEGTNPTPNSPSSGRRFRLLKLRRNGRVDTLTNASPSGSDEEEEVLQAKFHYTKALIDGCEYNLGDNAYVKAEDGKLHYIAESLSCLKVLTGSHTLRLNGFIELKTR